MKTTEAGQGVVEGHQAILQSAEALFAQKGYRGVSIDEIAAAAQVSKGLVHYHFTSKEELFCHLIREVRERLSQRLEAAMGQGRTVREKLTGVVAAYLSLTANQRSLWRIAMSEAHTLGGPIRELLVECRQANLGRMARTLEEGMASGELREMDPRLASLCLMGIISEVVLSSPTQDQPQPEALADHLMEAFFCGVATPGR